MVAEIVGVCAAAAALVALAICLDRQAKRGRTKRWCARPVQDEDTLKAMQERRRAAIEAAGESWLLHPSKSVKRRRKPRKPGARRA